VTGIFPFSEGKQWKKKNAGDFFGKRNNLYLVWVFPITH
jgi:hypothetical protein